MLGGCMANYSVFSRRSLKVVILFSLLVSFLLFSAVFGTPASTFAQTNGWSADSIVANHTIGHCVDYPSPIIDSHGDVQLVYEIPCALTSADMGPTYTKLSFDGTKLIQDIKFGNGGYP